MSIELTAASPEEIAEFKLAAALRYRERGVPPKQAEYAFNQYLAKAANQLGLVQPPSDRVQQLAKGLQHQFKKAEAADAEAASEAARKILRKVTKKAVE